jgi:cardiolipin synthase
MQLASVPSMIVGEAEFGRAAAAYGGTPIVGGNSVDILVNGDQIFARELAAIDAARTSVTYSQYFWADGEIGRQFTKALADRCRAGVAVHLLLDAVGSLTMPGDDRRHLEEAGCQVVLYRPLTSLFAGRFNYRNHRRILVVDGIVGFTGGAGVSDKWIGDGRQAGHWRDTTIEIRGPAVPYLQAAFVQTWTEATGVVLVGASYFPGPTATGTIDVQVLTSAPEEHDTAIHGVILLAMESARRSILITNPYFVPDAQMTEALVRAVDRRVRVVVLAPGSIDHNLVRMVSRHAYGRLLAAGVEIYEYRPALLHAKTMVIDDVWATVGTTNFDARSFRLNREINVACYSRDVAARLSAIFADDMAYARRVTVDEWRSRPFLQRLLELLAWPLRHQL